MIFDGCLLACDIDHTLAEKDQVCDRTKQAISYFMDNGGRFAIATGRHQLTAKWAYDLVSSNSPAITFGNAVYDYEQSKFVYAAYIPDHIKNAYREMIERFPEMGTNVFVENDIYSVHDNESSALYREYMSRLMGKPFLFAKPDEIFDLNWVKINFFNRDPDVLGRFINGCESMGIPNFFGTKSETWIYEVSAKNSDKGSALKNLAKHFDIDSRKIFAIGDFYIDLPMIKYAAVGAAVANAPDDVRSAADIVVSSCSEGGVADFIEFIERRVKTGEN